MSRHPGETCMFRHPEGETGFAGIVKPVSTSGETSIASWRNQLPRQVAKHAGFAMRRKGLRNIRISPVWCSHLVLDSSRSLTMPDSSRKDTPRSRSKASSSKRNRRSGRPARIGPRSSCSCKSLKSEWFDIFFVSRTLGLGLKGSQFEAWFTDMVLRFVCLFNKYYFFPFFFFFFSLFRCTEGWMSCFGPYFGGGGRVRGFRGFRSPVARDPRFRLIIPFTVLFL